MHDFNLINWRRRDQQIANNRVYLLIVLAIIVGLLLSISYWLMCDYVIRQSKNNVTILAQELVILEPEIAQVNEMLQQISKLRHRTKVLADLQDSNKLLVHIWQDLSATIPDKVNITILHRIDSTLTITGMAGDHAQVTEFLTKIQALPWAANSSLTNTQTKQDGVAFDLEVILRETSGESNENARD